MVGLCICTNWIVAQPKVGEGMLLLVLALFWAVGTIAIMDEEEVAKFNERIKHEQTK